ncbi:MAG: DUF3768 domain-containing protein [Verrucomicrobiae bacterium]|nr:DUF3768 domain-containing protein [Verrucomicrobiae bacterium]
MTDENENQVDAKTKRIRELNDQLRSRCGVPIFGEGVPGGFLFTPGIASLLPEIQIAIWAEVRNFSAFTEENDPYGEHDFGAFTIEGAGKVFWKIDYYDHDRVHGSEDPADLSKTFRVLTIMLAEEY